MVDFLTRLSERAMGRTPTVEPLIAPRFASDTRMVNPNTELIEEELTTSDFQPHTDLQKHEKVPKPGFTTRESNAVEKQSAHRSSISDQELIKTHRPNTSIQPDPRANNSTPKSRKEAAKSDLTSKQTDGKDKRPIDTDVPRPQVRNQRSVDTDVPRPQVRHQRSVDTDVPQPQITPANNSPLLPPIQPSITNITQVGHHPFSDGKPDLAQTSDKAPTIKVSIGRIEVRAVTSPQVRNPSRPNRPAPTLSLEDYLKQRNEGRR